MLSLLSYKHIVGGIGYTPLLLIDHAPVAQLDRVPGYEPGGREFESLRARQILSKTLLYRAFVKFVKRFLGFSFEKEKGSSGRVVIRFDNF